MLTCQSCFRKHMQSFLQHSIQSRATYEFASSTAFLHTATASRHQPPYSEDERPITGNDSEKSEYSEDWREKVLGSRGRGRTPTSNVRPDSRLRSTSRAVRKHLVFLKDPLKLANDVRDTLRKDRFEEAQEVVRTASKDLQCVVSWNHLIDWQMSQGKVNGAVKTYNEMKKRAQEPDSRTYTILFRGFAAQTEYPHALAKALSIYHSMTLPTSRVKPNNIHTNAMLKVCSRAGDMDALFTVAAKLPSQGFGAADNLTFTIILNAIREHAARDTHGRLTEEERKAEIKVAIANGRRMWYDIITRWRKADMFIDEELVCSMGRLLLIGEHPKDWDDVFSLVQQTMNIPRPFARLGMPERDRHEPSRQSQSEVSNLLPDPAPVTGDIAELGEKIEPNDEFQMVKPPPPNSEEYALYPSRGREPQRRSGGYVRPGNNGLQLVLEAMQKSSMKRFTKHYWDAFTVTHEVRPDRSNYAQMLRVLRSLRASSDALEIFLQMDNGMLERKMFRIALSTCERDKLNPNAFATAGKLLDLMQRHLEEPDPQALHSYLCVSMARASEYQNPSLMQAHDEKMALGRQILRALHRLQPCVVNIKSYLNYGHHEMQSPGIIKSQTLLETAPTEAYVESVFQLFTRIVSAYDKLIRGGMVDREKLSGLKEDRSIMSAFVNRMRLKLKARYNAAEDPEKTPEENRAAQFRARSAWIAASAEPTKNPKFTRVENDLKEERKLEKEEVDQEEPRIDPMIMEAEQDRLAAERVRLEMGLSR